MNAERRVLCPVNQGLADYVLQKKREHAADTAAKGFLSKNMERTFSKAYQNVCDAKDPIKTLKDLSLIKGFGKLMTKIMKGYFVAGDGSSEQEDTPENSVGKKAKGRKHYIPRKNTAAYALLITLHRRTVNGKEFMLKEELIAAADASGLSDVPIASEKGKGKPGLGNSKRELYSGWSCMNTTLIRKGLVVKYSNPGKYKPTVEGQEVANECIMRSGLHNSLDISDEEMDPAEQPKKTPNQNCTSMREEHPYNSGSGSRSRKKDSAGPSRAQTCQVDLEGSRAKKFRSCNDGSTFEPCSSFLASDGTKGVTNISRLPPLTFGEVFEEAYQVILIVDDREKFATKGTMVENICSKFKIKIEVRRLPVGDCIWIARHKCDGTEYVLDFIVERKNVDDLRSSFGDNRYRDQKLRLQRSGFKKLIYIVEGDPNQCEVAESLKTACFTTEIREGFNVLRTNGLGETLRTYGYLTHSIYEYYKSRVNDDDHSKAAALCPSFNSFVERCQDLDKKTISDVFAIQLMQVPQVTEEVAIAVLNMYPTLLSLTSAYSRLEGNVSAQEQMLNQSNNEIGESASKSIFSLVWG